MTNQSKLDGLKSWMHANDIVWSTSTVTLCGGNSSEDSFAIEASRDISEHETLCEIPKDAVLSIRNSVLANLLKEEELGGGLGLILAIMYEVSLGKESKWHGYLHSLPPCEYLPLFWQDSQLALLQGTELAGKADADRILTQEDWETNLLPLIGKAKYPQLCRPDMNLTLFRVAASWVASRAFGVDNYHGMAMVPFADLFNHKAAVVQLGSGYFVEDVCLEGQGSSESEGDRSDDDAEEDLGSQDSDENQDLNEAEEEANSDKDEEGMAENVVQPMTLEADRSGPPTRGFMLDPSMQQDPKLRLEIGICGVTKADGTEVLQILAASDLKAGREIFNTYGEHGNAELVNKYGFALPDNPFDAVQLDKDGLINIATKQMGNEACQQRCNFLSDQSHLLEEDLEPFEVLPKGKIGPSLLMALRVLFASEQDFSSWLTLADAMPDTGKGVDTTEAATAAAAEAATKDAEHGGASASRMNGGTTRAAKRQKQHLQKDNPHEDQEEELSAEPSCKRQKTARLPAADDKATLVPTDKEHDRSSGINSTGNGQAEHAPSHAAVGSHSSGADQSSDDAADSEVESDFADEDSKGDMEELQLGNVGIAEAGRQVLSHCMLQGLQTGIQQRLSKYATADLEEDLAALAEAKAASLGPTTESLRAQQAALQLCIGEKTLLHDALKALVQVLGER